MSDYSTIAVEPDTKEEFKKRLRGGDRQDELVKRMIEAYDEFVEEVFPEADDPYLAAKRSFEEGGK